MQQGEAAQGEPSEAQKAAMQKVVKGALLTREQVAKLVPFDLAGRGNDPPGRTMGTTS